MAYLCKDQKVHSQLYAYQIPTFNLVPDDFKSLQNWNLHLRKYRKVKLFCLTLKTEEKKMELAKNLVIN